MNIEDTTEIREVIRQELNAVAAMIQESRRKPLQKLILSVDDVKFITGWSRDKIYQKMKDGELTPLNRFERKKTSKHEFYLGEVLSLIPEALRTKYEKYVI